MIYFVSPGDLVIHILQFCPSCNFGIVNFHLMIKISAAAVMNRLFLPITYILIQRCHTGYC